jgi:hypothetical protein
LAVATDLAPVTAPVSATGREAHLAHDHRPETSETFLAWTVPSAPAGIDRAREIDLVAAICRASVVGIVPPAGIDRAWAAGIDRAWAAGIVPNCRASAVAIVLVLEVGPELGIVLELGIGLGEAIVLISTTSMLAISTSAITT